MEYRTASRWASEIVFGPQAAAMKLDDRGLIIGGTVGGIFLGMNYYRSPEGKKTIDSVAIDIHVIGDLIIKAAIARFTRTLSTLLGSGVNIMEALDIASKVVGNHVIESALLRAREAIAEGKSLTVPLAKEKYIPR